MPISSFFCGSTGSLKCLESDRQPNLKGANLSGARMRGAILSGADCKEADFEGADLREVEAFRVNFIGANLAHGRSDGASFAFSGFVGATWTGHQRQNVFDGRESDDQAVFDEGVYACRHIMNNRFMLGWTIHDLLGSSPEAEFTITRVLVLGYGCWQRVFEQLAGYFPDQMIDFVTAWCHLKLRRAKSRMEQQEAAR